jgi:hypothetical protein
MEKLTEAQVRDLAAALHAKQVDKPGQPYIDHLQPVVRDLKVRWPDASPDKIDAAWLHDVIEDTGATPEWLLAAGVSPAATSIVKAVIRPPSSIFLLDNRDNPDPARVAALAGAAERVATRYEPACQLLEHRLARMAAS